MYIKYILLAACLLLSKSIYAEDGNFFMTGFVESHNADDFTATATGNVRGFGIEIRATRAKKLLPYVGVTISEITSDTIISEVGDPYIMTPAYAYAGLALKAPISPFAEFGTDIMDAFWSDGSDGEENYVDAYVAFGATLNLGNAAFIKYYYKKYWIRPYLQPNVTLSVIGTMAGVRF